MKKHLFLLLIAVPMIFASCGTSKFFSGKASDISSIALVSPYSYLTDAVGDFQTDYVEAPSQFNQQLLSEAVGNLGLPISKSVDINYKKQDENVSAWMRRLANVGAAGAKNLEVPSQIVDAVKKSGCPYGLLITDVGYVKNAAQYKTETTIEAGMKIADLVLNNEVDLSKDTEACMSGVFSMLFDSQTGKPVWFGALPRDYKNNPINRDSVKEQMVKLFKDFLK